MITNGFGARGALCTMVLAVSLISGGAVGNAMATGPDLLTQCWSPGDLAARVGEKPPRRGAKGHERSIPDVRLAPFSPVGRELRGSIRRVSLPKGRKLVALTFDLCEQPGEVAGYDGAIVDYLRANNVRATFFAGGKWMMSHGERAQQLIADRRFEIGNHGWVHRNLRGLSGRALTDEIQGPQRAYEATRARLSARQCVRQVAGSIGGVAPRMGLYRFPYGACNAQALDALADNGLLAIQWDVSSGDASRSTSANAIARNVLGSVRPGSIVLLHANGRGYNTAEALGLIVSGLKAKGYEMVTVGTLLAAGTPVITPTCYDHRPGDTERYDRLFSRRTGGGRDAGN